MATVYSDLNENALFLFAAPPKTGCTWWMTAMLNAELEMERKGSTAVHYPSQPSDLPTVTLTRDPADWIRSYYQNMKRRWSGVPEVDAFQNLEWKSLEMFVESYIQKMPGGIGKMFDAYKSDFSFEAGACDEIIAWIEQTFPDLEFKKGAIIDTKVPNPTKDKIDLSTELRQAIYEAEKYQPVEA